jgi:hypothetical protein
MIDSKRLLLIACIFLLSACNNDQKAKDSQLALMKTTEPTPIMTDKSKSHDRVEDINRDVSSLPEVYDVAVVKGQKDTLVVYKVKHMERFKMKKIEQDINKMLEKKYPKENFTVSSDYKIFLEAVRLNERIKANKNYSKKKAEKRLQQIITMTKEMT